MNKKVCLVTTTFTKDGNDMRFKLALKTCQMAREHEYPIYIVDGSPDQMMQTQLILNGATKVNSERGRGMGASRRQCLLMGLATNADVIIWLEPEKHTIVPLLGKCVELIQSNQAQLVVPRRRNLDGYPMYQQLSEHRGNWEIGNILGRTDLDLYIGPRVMNRAAATIMASYNGKCGENTYGDRWEILFIPIAQMISAKMNIQSVVVDYVHPTEQLVEDDELMRKKRDEQFKDLVESMGAEAKRLDIVGLPGFH